MRIPVTAFTAAFRCRVLDVVVGLLLLDSLLHYRYNFFCSVPPLFCFLMKEDINVRQGLVFLRIRVTAFTASFRCWMLGVVVGLLLLDSF